MKGLRIDKTELLDLITEWDKYVKGKVHLVACGGTALTLQDLKPSTKDVETVDCKCPKRL